MPSERTNADSKQGPAAMSELFTPHFYYYQYNRTAIALIALKKGKARVVPIQKET
jgi:hypothetical protein